MRAEGESQPTTVPSDLSHMALRQARPSYSSNNKVENLILSLVKLRP